ncbi:hypothetical protein ABN034_34060 [Actinopolymorpha sp. B11F2]|uniref:hypothetical protein n=1 Tax=Actinopolymorpha sp. B11F2 TaxID=3160862 RepID=UPI0032E4BBD0
MGRRPKQPNRRLAALLDDAGLTHKGLARRVVERARACGLSLSYDHNSVRRWLAGEHPRPPAPDLIVDVLSEMLGRTTSTADAGMRFGGDQPADLGLEFPWAWTAAVDTVTALWRSDVERRSFQTGVSYAVGGYAAASTRWLTLPGTDDPSSTGRRRSGQAEVNAVRSMTEAFRDLDNRVGGGRLRHTVVAYLDTEVSPLLHGTYTGRTGRQLFAEWRPAKWCTAGAR